jgi:hypothetical protein
MRDKKKPGEDDTRKRRHADQGRDKARPAGNGSREDDRRPELGGGGGSMRRRDEEEEDEDDFERRRSRRSAGCKRFLPTLSNTFSRAS